MSEVIDKAEKYFKQFGDQKLLLLFDNSGDFLDDIKSYSGDDFDVDFYDNNPFSKKIKYSKLLTKNTLLYFQSEEPKTRKEFRNFPLTDLLVAHQVLRLDDSSSLLEELGWDRQYFRIVEKFGPDLKFAYVQDLLKSGLPKKGFIEKDVIKTLCLAWCGAKENRPNEWLVGKILTLSTKSNEADFEKFQGKIEKYELSDYVLKVLFDVTGVKLEEFNHAGLIQIIQIIKYNGILGDTTETKERDAYIKLKIRELTRLHRIEQFRKTVLSDPQIGEEFLNTISENAHLIKETEIVKVYGIEHEYGWYNTELVIELAIAFSRQVFEKPELIIHNIPAILINERSDSLARMIGNFLYYCANVIHQLEEIQTYTLDSPREYIDHYKGNWYKIDQNYRLAMHLWKMMQLEDVPRKLDIFGIRDDLNILYRNFLIHLNREWLKSLSGIEFKLDLISETKITDFHKSIIKTSEVKTAVIISDALRYEAAEELLRKLHEDTKNVSEMELILAGVPSNTAHGKAALLPAKERVFDGSHYLNDQLKTKTTEEREQVLQTIDPDARARLIKDIVGLNQSEARELFKTDLIYIYHDRIDETGDKLLQEQDAFKAIKETVDELSRFIAKLHHTYNVTRVIVTADHGFLYIDEPLEEVDMEQHPSGDFVAQGSRYQMLSQSINPEIGYCFPMNHMSDYISENHIVIPTAINRYKNPGSGVRFVHGGASIQELLVPVITSTRKKKDVSRKVNPMIVGKDHSIVSGILKFHILQETAVSQKEKERTILAGIYAGTERISDEQRIVLNSSSQNPSERMSSVLLTLALGKKISTVLNLRITDEEDPLNPIIEMKVTDKSTSERDF